jgi:hypothetical protein
MKTLAVNSDNLILNGSFKNSYWAADIDLYEAVSDRKAVHAKLDEVVDKYDVIEIKVALRSKSYKYKRLPPKLPLHTVMVKVDIILQDILPFPIECSVIYDFNSEQMYNETKVIKEMIDDLEKKKYSLFKKVKRLNSIAGLIGMKDLFADITEDTRLGLLNLTIERLALLNSDDGKKHIDDIPKYKEWIAEDLRKLGITLKDNHKNILEKEVHEKLNKIIIS